MNELSNTEQQLDTITELGHKDADNGYKVISIIGQIEGHSVLPEPTKATKYEHMIPLILEAEQSPQTKGILVILNTVGGDVEAGLALAELIRGMSKPSVSLVLGGGHSIGVPLAVSAKRSFIVPTASMTIHPLRASGMFITVPKSFEYYIKMQKRIIDFVCQNSSISEEHFKALMNNNDQLADDTGTVLIGHQAVDCGLIDEAGGVADALACLRSMAGAEPCSSASGNGEPPCESAL